MFYVRKKCRIQQKEGAIRKTGALREPGIETADANSGSIRRYEKKGLADVR